MSPKLPPILEALENHIKTTYLVMTAIGYRSTADNPQYVFFQGLEEVIDLDLAAIKLEKRHECFVPTYKETTNKVRIEIVNGCLEFALRSKKDQYSESYEPWSNMRIELADPNCFDRLEECFDRYFTKREGEYTDQILPFGKSSAGRRRYAHAQKSDEQQSV